MRKIIYIVLWSIALIVIGCTLGSLTFPNCLRKSDYRESYFHIFVDPLEQNFELKNEDNFKITVDWTPRAGREC